MMIIFNLIFFFRVWFLLFFKVREFVNGYIFFREMGFFSNNVVEVFFMFDNDTDKVFVYFFNNLL